MLNRGWLMLVLAISSLPLLLTCQIRNDSLEPVLLRLCVPADTKVSMHTGPQRIDAIELGMRVRTDFLPDSGTTYQDAIDRGRMSPSEFADSPDEDTWKVAQLSVALENDPETLVTVKLLRPINWLEGAGVSQIGDSALLSLTEFGLVGIATLTAIEPCSPFAQGDGRLVTGIVAHDSDDVIELKFESGSGKIRCTSGHPLYSDSRQNWVDAGELVLGEKVRARDGSLVVKSVSRVMKNLHVLNIEVDVDHRYFIGSKEVLSHNTQFVLHKR